MSVDWEQLKKLVQDHQRFLLTSHLRPDCDALGSELAMAHVLRSCGKDVVIVNDHAVPENLQFIDPKNEIKTLDEYQAESASDPEVIMILDTSAWVQLGRMAEYIQQFSGTVAVMDHHVGEDKINAHMLKDTSAEATGRLVAEAAHVLGVRLTPEIATPAFAAIATDTGWFRFSSVSERTYTLAGELIGAGADPADIYGQLYERDTVGRVRLRGLILSRTELEMDGRLVHTYVRLEDFEVSGANPTDTEDAINLTLAVAGTQVAVIFIHHPENEKIKISFRSRGLFDCNQMAGKFGGGGHKAASGAHVAGELDDVRQVVLDAVRAEMKDA